VSLLIPDLSEWQGDAVDWRALVGGSYPIAIIRAYNGTRPDHTFERNRAEAHAAGIRGLGLYAYLEPGTNELDQAAEFVKTVGALKAGEWPIVDCETGANAAARVRAWTQYVARALGYENPWQYAGESFYRANGMANDGVPASRTWIAAYGPNRPADGEILWQYTDHRTIPGVATYVDCSAYNGTADELLALVAGKPKPTPAPPKPAPTPGPTAHARYPYPTGIHPGGTSPSARPLQRALKKTGWMKEDVAESDHYGPATATAVEGFNHKHGLNSAGVALDPAIGPHGWALLMTLAYGAA